MTAECPRYVTTLTGVVGAAAVMDSRARYDKSIGIHRWTKRWSILNFVDGLGVSGNVASNCGTGTVARFGLVIYAGGSLCWILAGLVLYYCVALKLAHVGEQRAAMWCRRMLAWGAFLGLFAFSVWVVPRVAGNSLNSEHLAWLSRLAGLAAIGASLPGLVLPAVAVAAMLRAARTVERDVAEGGVCMKERGVALQATRWCRVCAASAGMSCGMTLVRIGALGGSLVEQTMAWRAIYTGMCALDAVANLACALMMAGFVGPRLLSREVEIRLQVAGQILRERRERDVEELAAAAEYLQILDEAPVPEEMCARLHDFEVRMSEPDVTNAAGLFKEYKAVAAESHEHAMQLMGKCIHAYTLMPSRWTFLTSVPSLKASTCHQERPAIDDSRSDRRAGVVAALRSVLRSVAPSLTASTHHEERPAIHNFRCDRRAAVDAYFEDLYAAMTASEMAFHETFERALAEFSRADTPGEIGLAGEDFPFLLHRACKPAVRRGPLKEKKRAREKLAAKPGSETAWPPLASEILDLVRTSVLFEDAYELVAFLAHLKRRFEVVRVKNHFEGFGVDEPVKFRNVNTNLAFKHGGRRLVAEAQLHLKATYMVNKMDHAAYEVIRATNVAEVCGPPWKWAQQPPALPLARTSSTRVSRRKVSRRSIRMSLTIP